MSWGGRAGRPLAALLGLLPLACCHVPRAERYFDREEPYDALNGFAYAVEVGDYRFAYDTLTPRSQELIPFSKFKLALRFNVTLPEAEISLRDLILCSKRSRYSIWQEGPRNCGVLVEYRTPDGKLNAHYVWLEREREADAEPLNREPIWRIDIERTFSSFKDR